jgi:hypothetical protein
LRIPEAPAAAALCEKSHPADFSQLNNEINMLKSAGIAV